MSNSKTADAKLADARKRLKALKSGTVVEAPAEGAVYRF